MILSLLPPPTPHPLPTPRQRAVRSSAPFSSAGQSHSRILGLDTKYMVTRKYAGGKGGMGRGKGEKLVGKEKK